MVHIRSSKNIASSCRDGQLHPDFRSVASAIRLTLPLARDDLFILDFDRITLRVLSNLQALSRNDEPPRLPDDCRAIILVDLMRSKNDRRCR